MTATEVAAVQPVVVEVVEVDDDPVGLVVLLVPVGVPEMGVWLAGKLVAVAEVYEPWTEVA